MSRIVKQPIDIPETTEVTVEGTAVSVKVHLEELTRHRRS